MLHKEIVTVTSAADGSGTATAANSITGFLHQIDYIKTDFVNGVDVTFNVLNSLVTDAILTVSNMDAAVRVFPRAFPTDLTGTTAAAGYIPLAVAGRPSVTVANAGDTKTGTFIFWWTD